MPHVFRAAALSAALVLVLAACTPTYNWREMTLEPTGLRASFPCKPDTAERKMPFTRERELVVHATGCETGGAAYAVLWADTGSPAEAGPAMAQWKQASLAAQHALMEREDAFQPRGSLALPQSLIVRAAGKRPDGSALQSQSAYFARGSLVFQAVVYAGNLKPEMADPFFTGLRFE